MHAAVSGPWSNFSTIARESVSAIERQRRCSQLASVAIEVGTHRLEICGPTDSTTWQSGSSWAEQRRGSCCWNELAFCPPVPNFLAYP